ncbi:hypothetical protein [Amycolatopsis sp. FDAARGOS 1241]|uniref:hypothetical protein n=1 Tax=Amycolatopsis sp. FDAARGOS 1241 TaxID=2778070 RepID=UPI001950C7C0|nr:hypothetical protein [Amycolatopsis sp. FDAARGOS 1241]QRP43446.1 hypothetical protein I6J71_29070 [Amycolatopsis sp. FDAARGOS 1241]
MTEEPQPPGAATAVFNGPDTAAAARVTLRAMLAHVPEAIVGDAVQLMDELVTDAGRDGATFRGLRLSLVQTPPRLRIDVERDEPETPAATELSPERVAGRFLIEDLASTWWSHTLGDISVTRAELVLPAR